MKRFSICLIIIFNMISGTGSSQDLSHIPGAFVDIGFGARALGMGGAFVATADDIYSIVWNPAGLCRTPSWQGTFAYTRQFDIVPYSFLAASGRLNHLWAYGGALIISGDALMNENRFVMGIARSFYGTLVPGLMLGTTLEFRQASFGRHIDKQSGVSGEAYGFALTLGIRYQFHKHGSFGLKLQDFINTTYWNTSAYGSYTEGTPFVLVWGIALQKFKGFNVELDINQSLYRDTASRLLIGTEFEFFHFFVLRSGFSRCLSGKESNLQYALGVGIKNIWKDHFRFDFAYLIHPIQNYYRISVIYLW